VYPSIESTVSDIFSADWSITDGRVVPKTDDIVLKNGGKLINATYLYADLAGSSRLAQTVYKETTAKIIRAYINTATRILRHYGGEIRSFDGDRVMAIFMGADKNVRATRAALAINWAVLDVIRPAIKEAWSDGDTICEIEHGIGIDTGEALIVRGGVRDNNDLISVGAAPNIAAKLSLNPPVGLRRILDLGSILIRSVGRAGMVGLDAWCSTGVPGCARLGWMVRWRRGRAGCKRW